jgi:hypothetical protein
MAADWLIGVDCVVLRQESMGTEFINKPVPSQDVSSALQKKPSSHSGTLTQSACHTDNCTDSLSICTRAILPARNIQKHNNDDYVDVRTGT